MIARGRAKVRAAQERRLADAQSKLQRYFKVIEAGGDPVALAVQLNYLQAEKLVVEAELADAPPADVIELHPNAARCYRKRVAAIHKAIRNGETIDPEAGLIIRSLIDHIVVEPCAPGMPVRLTVHGDLAALLQSDNQQGPSGSMVAGPGLEPGTYGL